MRRALYQVGLKLCHGVIMSRLRCGYISNSLPTLVIPVHCTPGSPPLDEEEVGDDQLETSVEHHPPPETLSRPRFRGGFRCLFASGLFSLLPRRLLLHHRVAAAAAALRLVDARERAFLVVRASALPLSSSSFQCDVECRPGKGRPRKKTSEK